MAKTILVCSEKGGCGKSTVCEEIAYSLDRTQTPYSFYDLDGQGGTAHSGHVHDDPEVVLVDTPAGMNDATVRGLAHADLVVVTCNPTPREVQPLSRTLNMVAREASAPVLVVVTRMNRYTVADQFLSWLEGRVGLDRVCALPQSEAFPQSDGRGCSVVDVDRKGKAAEAVRAMCGRVRELAGLAPEDGGSGAAREPQDVLAAIRKPKTLKRPEEAARDVMSGSVGRMWSDEMRRKRMQEQGA